jgi:hypothetical protein
LVGRTSLQLENNYHILARQINLPHVLQPKYQLFIVCELEKVDLQVIQIDGLFVGLKPQSIIDAVDGLQLRPDPNQVIVGIVLDERQLLELEREDVVLLEARQHSQRSEGSEHKLILACVSVIELREGVKTSTGQRMHPHQRSTVARLLAGRTDSLSSEIESSFPTLGAGDDLPVINY